MFSRQIHEKIYYYSLILLAISLPLSIYTTSMFQLILAGNWLLEARFRDKWHRFRGERALWVFLILYLIHILAMLWTSDLAYGLKDLKIKLPLLALPIIIGTSRPLDRKQSDLLIHFFVFAVFIGTMLSMLALAGVFNVEINDYRDISLSISHIRFALLIVLSLAAIIYFLFFSDETSPAFLRIFYAFNLLWLPFFLIILKSMSGIIIFVVFIYFLLLRMTFRIRDKVVRFMVFVFTLLIPLFSVAYLGNAVKKFYTIDVVHPEDIDEETIEGNPYLNLPERKEIENGHYVWLHVCQTELEREWNRVSSIDYSGKTRNGNDIHMTLIRYMTSMGLRKDAAGFKMLEQSDIEAIEHGIANHIYGNKYALYPRIYEIIWEIYQYRLGDTPNNKSIVQRLIYMEAAGTLIKENFWTGVGTGDTKASFKAYYDSTNSPLENKRRRRAHNQYLTFIVAFGIFGFIMCMASILYPVFLKRRWNSYMVVCFLLIMGLSFFNEDTLETSAGATPFALFYMLFVFGPGYPWLKRNLRES